jgi:hypothetical protein
MYFTKLVLSVFTAVFLSSSLNSQTDVSPETKFNQSSKRQVSGNEKNNSANSTLSGIPAQLLQQYFSAGDRYDDAEKLRLSNEIEKYLESTSSRVINPSEYEIGYEENPQGDWYEEDVLVNNGDVGSSSFRQLDLQQADDGRLYLATSRRNVAGFNGSFRVFFSGNGGSTWPSNFFWNYTTYYIHSISMLVESRNNSVPDSTRILMYFIGSTNSNFNDARLYLFSIRRDLSASYTVEVAAPAPGNKFSYVSACSDGIFYTNGTTIHAVVREETNAGVNVRLHHFRSANFGQTHTGASLTTGYDDRYPSIAFSNETGADSVYIAVERHIAATEWEIRLITTSEIPSNTFEVSYVTDATAGIMYERPSITIQQRHFSLPQRVLVTCTKNDRAVYHGSTDGGATWAVDYILGLSNQSVDYTTCNSDTLTTGGGYFVAAYVDLNGDSVTVRRGVLGDLGITQHKRNSYASTGVLAPVCAVYKTGSDKYSAIAYSGFGPTNVFFNMENLITGITQTGTTIPAKYELQQNYPNPFNPVTNVEFAVPKSSFVKLTVFDILGREVETLVNEQLSAGTYKADWNAANHPSGVYFYKLETGGFTETKKMMLVK